MHPADHHVAVLGASRKPDRYSNQALHLLLSKGYRVTPIHPKLNEIEQLPVVHRLSAISEPVDTLTLYVGPQRLQPLIDELVELRPGRVIFNPGSETQALMQRLDEKRIPWLAACTLVMLRLGTF